ncbi:MAG TPA: ABC transporter permease [Candidatus Binataceae bacterium]|nr:ABC transporter permease [Candidatus Binataceae bacterium]
MAIPLKYNIRSLLVRRISTAMTAGGIALVVAVFVIVMAMVAGIGTAITDAGSPDNMVVVRRGATTETYSLMTIDQFNSLKYLPGIRRDAAGNPLASPELPVQTLLQRIGGPSENIVFRGVMPMALEVHDQVHISEGRMFRPGLNEVIVGKGLVGRYVDCRLGAILHFGRGTWKVVGIFEANGSSFESEVWGDIHSVQDEARRGAYYACARIKLAPGADPAGLIKRIANDPKINLEAESEQDYYSDEASVATQLRKLMMIVALIMGIGAIFGAMNTMYAAVSARTVEIGTLRALGFGPGAVMGSFLAESIALAMGAGVIGVLLALPMNGWSTTFGNFVTFSSMAFSFRVTSTIVIEALIFAATMGLLGGWLPARQAMRLAVVDALRKS